MTETAAQGKVVRLADRRVVRLYEQGALPAQRQAHALCRKHRHVAYIGGLGAGKTRWGAAQFVLDLLERDESCKGIIAAVDYPVLRDVVLPAIIEQLEYVQEQGLAISWEHKKQANQLVVWYGGHEFIAYLLHSKNSDRARGINAAFIYIDEAALVSRKAYLVLRGRLRGYKRLRMWVTSTPKGRRHWLYAYVTKHAVAVRARTADNPIVAADLEQLREEYGARLAAQELDGEFVDSEAAAFPELQYGEVEEVKRIVVGVDWGFRSEGAAVALAIGKHNKGFLLELVEVEKTRTWWQDALVAFADKLRTQWGVEPTFYADPEDPAQIAECKHKGLRMVGADNRRVAGWNALESVFERGVVSPACKRLAAMASAAEWLTDEQDNALVGEFPEDFPDHVLDAARYAVAAVMQVGAGKRWQVRGQGSYNDGRQLRRAV